MKISSTHILKSVVLAAALSLAAPLVMAQNIAMVNGKGVPKARFDAFMTQILKQGQQQKTPELEAKVREHLVMLEIFMQEAEKKGMQAKPDYKTQMELARQSILIQMLFTDFEAKSKLTEAEARVEYDKIKAASGDKEFRARHILVESEDEAKALIVQLKAGAKFEDLAKKSSKDAGSAENGGDLDWAAPGNFVPEFAAAMTGLEKGKFTETPVKSQFGFHIIKLEDSRAKQIPPFEEAKAQLMQGGVQEKLAKYREELKDKAKTDFKFSKN